VFADRPLVDVRSTSSVKTLSARDIENLTIEQTIASVIQQQPGVTVRDGEIHIRGGRSDETLVLADGVPLKNLTGGEAGAEALTVGSVAELAVIKGGWSSRYGQAMSGVIDARIKEGTERFHGRMSYTTDALVGNENLHFVDFQLEGPNPLLRGFSEALGMSSGRSATFHLSVAAELTDTYLPSIRDMGGDARLETGYRGEFFGRPFDYGSFFAPRGDNSWRLTFKSGWNVHPAHKLSVTYLKSLSFTQPFQEHDIGDVNRNVTSYPWAWSRRLDHNYTIAQDLYVARLSWRHSLSSQMYHETKAWTRFTARHQDVQGKIWFDYENVDDSLIDEIGLGHPYFIDTGDASDYRTRFEDSYGLDWELTRRTEHHELRTGLNWRYDDVQYFSLDATTVDPVKAPLGDEFDLFHVFPASGAVYLEDQLEYPGIGLLFGLRGDVFFPGKQAERLYERRDRPGFNADTRQEFLDATHEAFGRRYKIRWSPRLAVSHPITERSHLFFNFGRFTQWPNYFYLYAKTGGVSSEEFPRVGNPNLEPEVSAQYEFGAGHRFSEIFSLRTTVFFKDIYDYPTAIAVDVGERVTRRQRFFVYRNIDYARSRGFEIELQRRRDKHISFSASYSFSVANGKTSDPNSLKLVQALGGDARETELEEQFMWWNRPHKISLSGTYEVSRDQRPPMIFGWRLPRDWKLSLFWQLQSGEAYSPQSPREEPTGKDYSKNGPIDSVLDMNFSKDFSVAGRRFRFSAQARNLLNHRTALDVDPSTGEPWRAGVGQHWEANENPRTLLLNEYLVRETDLDASAFGSENNDVIRTITGTLNPAFASAPRTLRLGISHDW
jgi:outer membrane receptor protein involved in Fe transport